MSCKPGELVLIEFASADATTAAPVTLKDANLATRVLSSQERLLIDNITDAQVAAVTLAELYNDTNADGTVDANERIAGFTPSSGYFEGGEEGYPCKVGVTPKVKAAVAGIVRLNGVGRIVRGLGVSTRPSWKESEIKGQ